MANINQITIDGTTYDIEDTTARSSTGITTDIKVALLNCFQNVAWTTSSGQDYYDTLYDALYPPTNLSSISAVYTQSSTVYDTDSLNDLKADLVVTAHYDDSSTATVTTYTLSGTLEEGTSTITVTYGGLSTTFNVIVSSDSIWSQTALYPLTNGTKSNSNTNYGGTVTITDNQHIRIYRTGTGSSGGFRIDLTTLSNNCTGTTSWNTESRTRSSTTIFSIATGDVVRFVLNNITYGSGTGDGGEAITLDSANCNLVSTTVDDTTYRWTPQVTDIDWTQTSIDRTITCEYGKDVTCVGMNANFYGQYCWVEFDLAISVNGTRYI